MRELKRELERNECQLAAEPEFEDEVDSTEIQSIPLFRVSALFSICCTRCRILWLCGDNIQLHRYVVAGNQAAVIQHFVIANAPILAVDGESRGKSDSRFPHVVFHSSVIDKWNSYFVAHSVKAQ